MDIELMRHSAAHLMAHAIRRLFPKNHIEFGVGPIVENGFYYDVNIDHKFTDDDLKNIEAEMLRIMKENVPIVRKVVTKNEALNIFRDDKLKQELIVELPEDEEISIYQQGDFIDLCRGPHVASTGSILPYFKLLSTAGAYFKGDERNVMLQRIYATLFESKNSLAEYLKFREEAQNRDHRKLGTELNLFFFDEFAVAAPFFTPKGTIIYNELISFLRRLYQLYDYHEVITPMILDGQLWKISGHYDNYKENMFFTSADEKVNAVKPMNCPTHILFFNHHKYSYRELPLRIADFGRLHRYEKSGSLAGLFRVRSFSQDDGHIFLPMENMESEIKLLIDMFLKVYEFFKFKKVKINLSTRPDKKMGDDQIWDQAESVLRKVLDATGIGYLIKEGDGAFYGPKIDFEIADALNRYHQLGTIQLDFLLAARFDITYTSKDGKLEHPIIIHRAMLGSLERFFAILLEHVGGVYPFFLAPIQVMLIPVKDEHLDFCLNLKKQLIPFRVEIDRRNESLSYKTRATQKQKIPFMVVVGDKEISNSSLAVREYGKQSSDLYSIPDFISFLQKLDNQKRIDF